MIHIEDKLDENFSLTDIDKEVIKAYADCDMNVSRTAKRIYMCRNSVMYHLKTVEKKTGVNPASFYGLMRLITWMRRCDSYE